MLYLVRPSALFSRQRVPLDVPATLTIAELRYAAQTLDLSVTGASLALDANIIALVAMGQRLTLDISIQRASLQVRARVRTVRGDGIDLGFEGLSRRDAIVIQQLMKNGRRLRRTDVSWPVRLLGAGHRVATTTVDATENGLCVAGGSNVFSPGDTLRVQLDLPDGTVVDAMAEVTWGPRQLGMPLRMYGIEAHGAERLRACLAGVQDSAASVAPPGLEKVAIASPASLTISRFE